MNIWVTSDTHFCHDREFIYGPRGFSTVEEMNEAIVERWNSVVQPDDTVYHLGDVMLNDNERGLEFLQRLNGYIHIIRGNHDTDNRDMLYPQASNVISWTRFAEPLKYKGYHFMLSHYPMVTGNLDDSGLKHMTLNLFGHTHSKEKFYEDRPYMYNVAVDAHDCYPVSLDQIIEDMKNKVNEYIEN